MIRSSYFRKIRPIYIFMRNTYDRSARSGSAEEIRDLPAAARDYRDLNHLLGLEGLKNTYLILRHGESLANVEGMILSDPVRGTVGFGLTERGREQVAASVKALGKLGPDTLFVYSDFLRAKETAEVACAICGGTLLESCVNLRERFFGDLEGGQAFMYAEVSGRDSKDPFQCHYGVESAATVMGRVTSAIIDLESRFEGRQIVLVGHGDPLKILQMAMMKQNPGMHGFMLKLRNGELRELKLAD